MRFFNAHKSAEDGNYSETTNAISLKNERQSRDLSVNKHGRMLLTALLENFCQLYDNNPAKSKRLFALICHTLQKIGILEEEYIEELAAVRSNYQDALHHLILQAREAIRLDDAEERLLALPDPTNVFEKFPQETALSKFSVDGLNVRQFRFRDLTLESWLQSRNSRYIEDFEEYSLLGRGGFGSVYHVRNKIDGAEYAMKKINSTFQQMSYSKIFREIKCLAKMDHPNVIRYFSSWVESTTEATQMPIVMSKNSSRVLGTSSYCDVNGGDSIIFEPTESSALTDDILFAEDPGTESIISTSRKSSYSSITESSNFENLESPRNLHDSNVSTFNNTTILDDDYSSSMHISKTGPTHSFIIYIQMQLCFDDLESYLIRRNHFLSFPLCKEQIQLHTDLFRMIINGVMYVHEGVNLIHRDIKPSNIFLAKSLPEDRGSVPLISYNDKNDLKEYITPKIGDFGLVVENKKNTETALSFLERNHLPNLQDETQHIGTATYAAPELLDAMSSQHNKFTKKIDTFSLGMVLFELLHPFQTNMERATKLQDLRRGILPEEFVEQHICESSLILWMTAKDPTKRPSLLEVLNCGLLLPNQVSMPNISNIVSTNHLDVETQMKLIMDENQRLREQIAVLRSRIQHLETR
ncbi:PEK protein kinase Hri2 [Schizosaccharomyces pombe]